MIPLSGRFLVITLLALAGLTLAACAGQASAEPVPPEIHYGQDLCDFCGMIISEERYAAAYVTRAGQSYVFDDIGDMVQAHLAGGEDVAAFFVHDYQNSSWLRAEPAFYVLSPDLATPMGSGLVACAGRDEAAALAAETQGQVLAFEELLAHYQTEPPMAHQAHHD